MELEPLRFDGVIERADYQRMLPRGEQEWWLCLVLAVLLGICILVFGPVSVLFATFRGKAVGGLGLNRVLDADARRFVVSKTPDQRERSCETPRTAEIVSDILGTAQGEFKAGGLAFLMACIPIGLDRNICQTAVSADGMRVHVDASAASLLGIEHRMFDAFNVDSANRLKRHWPKLAETPVLAENPQGVELWNQISQPRVEAIPFVARLLQRSHGELQPSETRHSWSRVPCCLSQPSCSSPATTGRVGCSGAVSYC